MKEGSFVWIADILPFDSIVSSDTLLIDNNKVKKLLIQYEEEDGKYRAEARTGTHGLIDWCSLPQFLTYTYCTSLLCRTETHGLDWCSFTQFLTYTVLLYYAGQGPMVLSIGAR